MGYNPDEPRDKDGKWTSGGGGTNAFLDFAPSTNRHAERLASGKTGDKTSDKALDLGQMSNRDFTKLQNNMVKYKSSDLLAYHKEATKRGLR